MPRRGQTRERQPVANAPADQTTEYEPDKGGLSSNLRNSIWLMVSVSGASAFLLLFADFEGKIPRIAATFVVFAIFTVFAALDARGEGPGYRAPIAQVGNTYMLGLALIYTWASLLIRDFSDIWLIPKTVFLMLAVKAGIFVVQRIADLTYSRHRALAAWSWAAAVGVSVATVTLTLPIAVDFIVEFSDLYWRVVYVVLIVSGLSVAVTVLLYWTFRRQDAPTLAPPGRGSFRPAARPPHFGKRSAPMRTERPVPEPPTVPQEPFAGSFWSHQPNLREQAPQYAPPVQTVLPWPTFPDGRPLPQTPNGRPDWNALHHLAWMYANAEQQWFPTTPKR